VLLLNEIEKIVSIAAEIEIAEKDLDIITAPLEAKEQEKYLERMYNEMSRAYFKLVNKLYNTTKNSNYRYQLQSF